jgi:hypothetical protein
MRGGRYRSEPGTVVTGLPQEPTEFSKLKDTPAKPKYKTIDVVLRSVIVMD